MNFTREGVSSNLSRSSQNQRLTFIITPTVLIRSPSPIPAGGRHGRRHEPAGELRIRRSRPPNIPKPTPSEREAQRESIYAVQASYGGLSTARYERRAAAPLPTRRCSSKT
jgi:hypothetical protein